MPNTQFESKYCLTDDLGMISDKSVKKKGVWRIPSLRNVSRTAPYFHNASVDSLAEAVRIVANTQLAKKSAIKMKMIVVFIGLKDTRQIYSAPNQALNDKEIEDIVAFLKALNGEILDDINL